MWCNGNLLRQELDAIAHWTGCLLLEKQWAATVGLPNTTIA
jgi:hypothetical protein